ncbi:MAG: LiaF domain-containing protein [Psychrobium sp.]
MTVAAKDRPLDAVREEVIDRLIMNYSHGELSLEAFESRLDIAMESNDQEIISELAKDLPLSIDESYQQKKNNALGTHQHNGNAKELDKLINILSSSRRDGQWNVPQHIVLTNVLGSDVFDFTQAKFTSSHVKITVLSVLGSVSINVPEDVNIHTNVNCIASSISKNTHVEFDASAPTISIEGKFILSSLNIKVKRTVRDRLLRFADSMKAFFN